MADPLTTEKNRPGLKTVFFKEVVRESGEEFRVMQYKKDLIRHCWLKMEGVMSQARRRPLPTTQPSKRVFPWSLQRERSPEGTLFFSL